MWHPHTDGCLIPWTGRTQISSLVCKKNCSNDWKQLQITEHASCNLPSAGGHCWDKAWFVACLMCLGSAQHPHISRPSISFCLSGWARPNQNEIRKSGWQMLRERERAQDENAPCKYLQPKNYPLHRHKVSKDMGLHSGQQAKAKATSLTNSESRLDWSAILASVDWCAYAKP